MIDDTTTTFRSPRSRRSSLPLLGLAPGDLGRRLPGAQPPDRPRPGRHGEPGVDPRPGRGGPVPGGSGPPLRALFGRESAGPDPGALLLPPHRPARLACRPVGRSGGRGLPLGRADDLRRRLPGDPGPRRPPGEDGRGERVRRLVGGGPGRRLAGLRRLPGHGPARHAGLRPPDAGGLARPADGARRRAPALSRLPRLRPGRLHEAALHRSGGRQLAPARGRGTAEGDRLATRRRGQPPGGGRRAGVVLRPRISSHRRDALAIRLRHAGLDEAGLGRLLGVCPARLRRGGEAIGRPDSRRWRRPASWSWIAGR